MRVRRGNRRRGEGKGEEERRGDEQKIMEGEEERKQDESRGEGRRRTEKGKRRGEETKAEVKR